MASNKSMTRSTLSALLACLATAIVLLLTVSDSAFADPPIDEAAELTAEKKAPWVTLTGDIRARYEYGELSTLESSNALTLRSRLGLLTREVSGLQGFIEYEGTLVADRNSYQAASVHGLGCNKTIIADVFLATPPDGLQDFYAQFSAKLPAGINLGLWYHSFYNDDGSTLGREGDIVLSKKLNDKTTALVKYAYFDGDDPRFPDLQRLAAEVEIKF